VALVDERILEQDDIPAGRAFGTADLTNSLSADRLDATRVSLEFSCHVLQVSCLAGDEIRLEVGRAEVTLSDSQSPTVTGDASGSALSGIPLAGDVNLALPFADDGGGLETVALRADGSKVAETDVGGSGCTRPFVARTPCPGSGTAVVSVDTDRLTAGPHALSAVLTDVAGNATTVGPWQVTVRTSSPTAPPNLGPAIVRGIKPLPTGTVALSSRRTVRSRYSKPPMLKGTVKASDGSPLANVVVTTSDGTTAKTDKKGRFSVKLAKGPSREVKVSCGDSAQTVKVIVAAPIRLKTNRKSTRNGRSITFTGSVPGAGNARTRVELQALSHRKWVPFKTADLRDGTFKASYRFTRTFFTQRYSFRAVIHETPGFPYAAGTSAQVKVTVHA
jgi:hypothetical protein